MKPDDFANVLAGLRVYLPMTTIVEQMGISRQHGYRLERGEVRRISVDMVERVQRVRKNLAVETRPSVTHRLHKRA
jgi:hypothetical protein